MPTSRLTRVLFKKDSAPSYVLLLVLSPQPPTASVQTMHRDPPEWLGTFTPTVVVGSISVQPDHLAVSYCGLLVKTRLLQRNGTDRWKRERV